MSDFKKLKAPNYLPMQICFQKFTTATNSCPSTSYMARFDNENGNL